MAAGVVKMATAGIGIGLVLVGGAWGVELSAQGLPFDLDGLTRIHVDNPVLWWIDGIPGWLAVWGGWVGRTRDALTRSETLRRSLAEDVEDLQHYRSTLDHLSDGVILARRGAITYANGTAAKILGIAPEALQQVPFKRFVPGIQQGIGGTQVVHTTAFGEVVGLAWQHAAIDARGRPIQLEIASTMIPHTDLAAHLIRDVTEVQQTLARERRLHRALIDERDRVEGKDASRQRFLAGLAHELRTPLASMRGYLEIIEEEAMERQSPLPQRDLLRVRTATDQVLEVVEKVHDQARIEPGRVSLFFVPVDVDELLDEVAGTLRPILDGDVALEKVDPRDLDPCRADHRRLRQILLALGTHAARSTTKGFVRLQAEAGPAGSIRIQVEDSGAGIDSAELKTLFSPFVEPRAGQVGLATSHELATLMGGELSVTSQPGRGTTFTLQLPTALDGLKEERLVRARSRIGQGRVLLIVDDPVTRGLLEGGLGARGIQVVPVTSSRSAIVCAEALAPSAVVLDLGLRGADPWNEIGRITRPPLSELPIFGVSVVQGRAVSLPCRTLLPSSMGIAAIQDRVASVEHPGRPVLVFGAGPEIAQALRRGGREVVVAHDAAHAQAVVERAGVMVVDLLADDAAGLDFTLSQDGAVPIVGLVSTDSDDDERATARQLLLASVRDGGREVGAMVQELIREQIS